MKTNIFLAAVPNQDAKAQIARKINAVEAKRLSLIRLQWTHDQDLHATLGFIASVDSTDIRLIASGFNSVSNTSVFMATVGAIKLFGNALVMCLEPYPAFHAIHKKMNHALQEVSLQKYHFDTKKRYDPHITIARIRNLSALNFQHKQQLIALTQEQLVNTAFLIQQAALMRHLPEKVTPAYQVLQFYRFKK